MKKNTEKYLTKYIEVLEREQLDQSKTKLVIKNDTAQVISNKKLIGSIVLIKDTAVFQYEIG